MNRWKEASSLIISAACKNQIAQKTQVSKVTKLEKSNFRILALKKRETVVTTGKPQICVFPGGSVSLADSVQEWEGLFSTFGLSLNILSNSLMNNTMSNLTIFDNRNEDIPRWLSLRITAIRETFEECGILLCKNKQSKQIPSNTKTSIHTSNHFEIDQIESWRAKVLEDPYQFITLCKHSNCYPDVESLFLWSNWLTPSHLPERFDAVFFFTNVHTLALNRGSPDYREITSTEWLRPEELLILSDKEEIWLKPPQWFEIKTLLGLKDCNLLQNHSYQRSKECLQWMPVRVITIDGEVSLLPGDEMYPNEIDLFKPLPIFRKLKTMASIRCERMHRMEHQGVQTILFDTRTSC